MRTLTTICLVASAAGLLPIAMAAQQPSSRNGVMPNQTVYLEFGGNAGIVSLNYDRKLNHRFTVRVGSGKWRTLSPFSDQEPRFARLHAGMINYFLQDAPDSPHWLEIGVGAVAGQQWSESLPEARSEILSATGTLGYRRMSSHTVLRMGVAPQYAIRGDVPRRGLGIRFGASMGVAF